MTSEQYRIAMTGLHLDGEGSICEEQANWLTMFVRHRGFKNICETGFGLGWSAWSFLSASDDVRVTSCDIGSHAGALQAAQIVDSFFPNRHCLIVGDSKVSVPELLSVANTFDLVFIDGGHDLETAQADLRNFALPGRTVVIDDLVEDAWATGVVSAWAHALNQGIVRQEETFFMNGHGWAVGTYN